MADMASLPSMILNPEANLYAARAFQGYHQRWRWLLTGVLIVFGWLLTGQVLILLVQGVTGDRLFIPGTVFQMGFNFLISALVLPLALALIHLLLGFKPAQFVSGQPRYRWKRMALAAGYWLGAMVVVELLSFAYRPGMYHFEPEAEKLLGLGFITLVLVPFQAAAEEVFFRGYVQQTIIRFTRRPWFAILVSAGLFFLAHGTNPEFQKYGLMFSLLNYGGFGLLFGILAYLDEGLEAAIGLHAINNMYGTFLVGFDDSVAGSVGLFTLRPYDPVLGTLGFYVVALSVLFVLSRKHLRFFPDRILKTL